MNNYRIRRIEAKEKLKKLTFEMKQTHSVVETKRANSRELK